MGFRIHSVELRDGGGNGMRLPGHLERERDAALAALTGEGLFFRPCGGNGESGNGEDGNSPGPYGVVLSVEDGRLVIRLRNGAGADLPSLVLSLAPYRRLVRDYFLMIESYEQARAAAVANDRLEAIDMGRRGLHNEGADLFRERLAGKIEVDFETARRFFTLICVLHRAQTGLAG